ncbi:protein TolQ [Candidiatus Paracoxiella cheracis]|uniref:protein TolQ n=1 Tax=Candidiatus Paracoxiella cheracis TaxID=3405120 RepID=UPI003BF4F020
MTSAPSLWSFIINAGFVVKVVIMILLLASVASWTIIIQRVFLLKRTRRAAKKFEQRFWSGIELTALFEEISAHPEKLSGLNTIFHAGFAEYTRLKEKPGTKPEAIIEATQRAMRVAQSRETENLERNLAFLATVGSTSPYVGLFGTVWGIMTSFRALGTVQQATIAMVAPGISEALIATAIGLFAAIPAVVAYNRFSNELDRISQNYETFQEEFSNILNREVYG